MRPPKCGRSCPRRSRRSRSFAERIDDKPGRRGARVLLLAGDEVAVANRVPLEAALDDEVRAWDLAGLGLDVERLNRLADVLIGVGLLAVGESCPGTALHE